MTREEIIDDLECVMTPAQIASAVMHDAFDSFVIEIVSSGVYLTPMELVVAWSWYHRGWNDRKLAADIMKAVQA